MSNPQVSLCYELLLLPPPLLLVVLALRCACCSKGVSTTAASAALLLLQWVYLHLVPFKIKFAALLAEFGLLKQVRVPQQLREVLRQQLQLIQQLQLHPVLQQQDAAIARLRRERMQQQQQQQGPASGETSSAEKPPALRGSTSNSSSRSNSSSNSNNKANSSWLGGVFVGLKNAVLPVLAGEERQVGVENTFYYNYEKQRWEEKGREISDSTNEQQQQQQQQQAPPPLPAAPPVAGVAQPTRDPGVDRRRMYVNPFGGPKGAPKLGISSAGVPPLGCPPDTTFDGSAVKPSLMPNGCGASHLSRSRIRSGYGLAI
ncbi:sybindin-like family domain-containing protein [Cyclospora cayetanensis]|uniref:Sybindin-like family domain-containing protein n=1 Tax=Cyclospora cayetanensis TaxID=88456 RepID=A0A1D3D7J1_9EIME|nr:sybindin-like family domain-containing protein [Cyclospora cayetanensis]